MDDGALKLRLPRFVSKERGTMCSVELRPYSGAFLAEVHFALREVLDHEADARVLIRDAALLPAPAFVARAQRLVLGEEDRQRARARALLRAGAPREETAPAPRRTILVVGPRVTHGSIS